MMNRGEYTKRARRGARVHQTHLHILIFILSKVPSKVCSYTLVGCSRLFASNAFIIHPRSCLILSTVKSIPAFAGLDRSKQGTSPA